MSAVAEIQAAIDKLTKLRDESTQPTDGNAWIQGRSTHRYESTGDVYTGPDENTHGSADIVAYIQPEDAALIVTLHATIDAQMAILAAALKWKSGFFPGSIAYASALDLARSINGTP